MDEVKKNNYLHTLDKLESEEENTDQSKSSHNNNNLISNNTNNNNGNNTNNNNDNNNGYREDSPDEEEKEKLQFQESLKKFLEKTNFGHLYEKVKNCEYTNLNEFAAKMKY